MQIEPQPQIIWSAVYIAAHRAPQKQGNGARFERREAHKE